MQNHPNVKLGESFVGRAIEMIQQNKELEIKIKEAMSMLLNIAYWDTCPQDYKDRIKLLKK
jgi:hypothetical protein